MRSTILALSLLVPMSSLAVEGGTPLDWADHPYLIESNCTGTLVAGKYILIAGHCGANVSDPFPRAVNLASGESLMPTTRHADVFYAGLENGADFAIWELPTNAPYSKAVFLADLNDPAADVQTGDTVTFTGFGQDDGIPRLGRAENVVTKKFSTGFYYEDENAHSVPGDSGAPVFNAADLIVGINYAGSGSQDPSTGRYDQTGVNLQYPLVKDYILTTIDSWHSVTEVELTGTTTIEVQSLHQSPVDMAERWNAGTLTAGDAVVTGGSCVTDGAVDAFARCELTIESQGAEGAIHLEDGNTIIINPKTEETPDPEPEPDPAPGGKGGGSSMGLLSLLGLLTMAYRRRR